MRYLGATTFEGMIIWSARPQRGPLAPIGEYNVKITALGQEKESQFKLEMNPNLEGVTVADIQNQFDLAIQIRDKVSAANEAVIQIRSLKEQAMQAKGKVNNSTFKRINDLVSKLSVVEEALYQVKNQSPQDPLNFPIKLNNRLASLQRSVETGQAKPTNAAYKVFEELSLELTTQLGLLKQIVETDLKKLNSLLPEKISLQLK